MKLTHADLVNEKARMPVGANQAVERSRNLMRRHRQFPSKWKAGLLVVALGMAVASFISRAAETDAVEPQARKWVQLSNCRLVPHAANDGDSFHARWGNREFIFRLYFVDAPENSLDYPDQVAEQRKYFGCENEDVLKAGAQARAFTDGMLQKPFTVWTKWVAAGGRSRLPRYYAVVRTGGGDLGETLVAHGLARVNKRLIALPDGTKASDYLEKMLAIESKARHEKVGAWENTTRVKAPKRKSKATK